MLTRIKSYFSRVKIRVKSELEAKERHAAQAAKEAEFNMLDVPEGAIALPFNHVITIRNAHALYQSFNAIGQDCVLIDMSGGDLLSAAKENGIYDANYNYLVFDFDNIDGAIIAAKQHEHYSPSIPEITSFTETCRKYYSALGDIYEKGEEWPEDKFLQEAYESYEAFFESTKLQIPDRMLERVDFADILTRHWLANIVSGIKEGEVDMSLIFKRAWALTGKYIQEAMRHDCKAKQFEQFFLEHKFSRAVHFCGPYTLSGVLIKYAFHNICLNCTLFHDAFMPSDQMKKINGSLPNFKAERLKVDILYKNRSDQPAYELDPNSETVTLRYPIRTWASYDILGVPQEYLWATWLEYPLETVGVKNTAIAEKFKTEVGPDPRVKVIGNPQLESRTTRPPEINNERPNLLVSVAPDIFSAVRFSSTKYLTSMESYFDELLKLISVYAETSNVIIALHPRLTPGTTHYDLMSKLGTVAKSSTGRLLPHIDLFITYVGSVMNFDADELNVPMLALSLYDDAKSYSQNSYSFENMHIIETIEDMLAFKPTPKEIILRPEKVIPAAGSTARELLSFWSATDR